MRLPPCPNCSEAWSDDAETAALEGNAVACGCGAVFLLELTEEAAAPRWEPVTIDSWLWDPAWRTVRGSRGQWRLVGAYIRDEPPQTWAIVWRENKRWRARIWDHTRAASHDLVPKLDGPSELRTNAVYETPEQGGFVRLRDAKHAAELWLVRHLERGPL